MFTPPLPITFWIVGDAVIGIVVGVLAGTFASLLLRLKIRLRDVVADGFLGSVAFPLAFVAVLLVPWRNTIHYRLGDTLVTSTANNYQHPDLLAYTAAILLPALRELHRFRNRPTASVSGG